MKTSIINGSEVSRLSVAIQTDYTFQVHTVTTQEVGKSIIFTVPSAKVLDIQTETTNALTDMATATAANPASDWGSE